jgi:hypothetical protein
LKTEAYRQFCEHIAQGKPKREWRFLHPKLSLTYKTMKKYLKNEKDFPPMLMEVAESRGFAVWEQVVIDAVLGKNKKSAASLQMTMRNKFGWI